jgi:serine protease inhibitor
MKKLLAFSMAAVVACQPSTGPDRQPEQLTALPRELTADELRVSVAANQFAFNLFKRLNAAQPDSNLFVSPLSVSFALGMTLNGADGTTLDEMRSTLGFGSDDLSAINAGYRGLLALEGGLDPSTTFEIANSVWHRNTLPVHASFVQEMNQTFEADVRSAPFDPTTVTQVNSWVNEKTRGKIPTILEAISADDVMFLINAIYFKGSWREQFDPARTQDGSFNAIDGAQQVRIMNRPEKSGKIGFGRTPSATVGELSYGNGAFVMTIVIPDQDIDGLASALDTVAWRTLVETMSPAEHQVALPKFKLEYKRELTEDLQALGMNVPFMGGAADFTRMSPVGRDLFIGFVQHKTFVDVNEEGTEAAAVTNVGMRVTSLPPCLCVNKPFIFAIRERFSGTILFIGKIVRIPE